MTVVCVRNGLVIARKVCSDGEGLRSGEKLNYRSDHQGKWPGISTPETYLRQGLDMNLKTAMG